MSNFYNLIFPPFVSDICSNEIALTWLLGIFQHVTMGTSTLPYDNFSF